MPGKCRRLGVQTERPEHTMGHAVPREMSPARRGHTCPGPHTPGRAGCLGKVGRKQDFPPKPLICPSAREPSRCTPKPAEGTPSPLGAPVPVPALAGPQRFHLFGSGTFSPPLTLGTTWAGGLNPKYSVFPGNGTEEKQQEEDPERDVTRLGWGDIPVLVTAPGDKQEPPGCVLSTRAPHTRHRRLSAPRLLQ